SGARWGEVTRGGDLGDGGRRKRGVTWGLGCGGASCAPTPTRNRPSDGSRSSLAMAGSEPDWRREAGARSVHEYSRETVGGQDSLRVTVELLEGRYPKTGLVLAGDLPKFEGQQLDQDVDAAFFAAFRQRLFVDRHD